MKTFLTGGTGFVGFHLARALVDRGHSVRCLVRPATAVADLAALPVEIVRGDLRDAEGLRRTIAGAEVVYHCAADYRLWVPDPAPMYASNVDGTANVLDASAACGVRRVVYTSTVGALGLRTDGLPADEGVPVRLEDMIGHYKRSKFLAERVAEDRASRGLDVVIVNPSAPVGERDVKPTATGRIIADFLRGAMPAYVDTGLNLIDVRDVAAGHVLAAERGRPGEKYILGHRNVTLKDMLRVLSEISGVPAPRVRLPHWIPLAAAWAEWGLARVRGREPRIAIDAVRLARHLMYFDPAKAVRELGLPQTPIEAPLERAVRWFRERPARSRAAA